MKNEACTQMELGMNANRRLANRQQRRQRAEWWFRKMRQVVDLALPPRSMGAPRPEQTYLKLRQTSLL